MHVNVALGGLLALCSSLVQSFLLGEAPASCDDRPLDVVFVLDSSASQGSNNFRIQKDFVINFVNQSGIGPDHVQVGLVTFTTTAKNEFYLHTYTNKTSIMSAVQALPFRSGTSAADKGINIARYFQLAPYNGARRGVSKLVIVMTDGRSNDMDKTLYEAYLLQRTADTIVVTVGVGLSLDPYELEGVASGSNYTFALSSHDLIPTVMEKVKAVTCADCRNKMVDIVFLLDSSASEGVDNFQRQVDFVRDLVSRLTIGPQNVLMSVVVFSSQNHEEFSLGTCQDKPCLLAALSKISYKPGKTETGIALSYARSYSFSPTKGSRGTAAKVVVVITDGRSSNPQQTTTEASLLKHMADIISIGVGVGVDQTELLNIASDRNHSMPVVNFDALRATQSQLVHLTCHSNAPGLIGR